jgi:hypothetical protein
VLTDLQRAHYHQLRKEWGQRWWYTARRAYDLASRAELFAVSRTDFYRRVRLG